MGVISAAGGNLSESLVSLELGQRNAGPLSLFSSTLGHPVFEVKSFPPAYHLEGQRTLSLALIAADQALREARLTDDLSRYRVGVCLGTTVASQLNDIGFYMTYRQNKSAPLTAADRYLKGNLSEYIARRAGASGPRLTVVNACSSGTDAIGVALSWLNSDLCDIVITGGADELNHIPYCGFNSLSIMNPGLCSPFDRDRKGLNLGEGSGILIIEKRSVALERGMSPDLFLAGFGASADAHHLTAPSPDGVGLRESMTAAFAEAGIGPQDICFVNAHGTGTLDNDMVEGNVLADVLGANIQMLSTKGYTGHTLGAAGGIEAVFTAAALKEGWIPASAGFVNKDDSIPVTPVRKKTLVAGRYALSTSLAFGGNNSALIIGRGAAI